MQPRITSGSDRHVVDPAFQQRVDTAAFAITREGRNPTIRTVRQRMGGGDSNRVAAALAQWRVRLGASLQSGAGSASDSVPPAVQELLEALWARALYDAQRLSQEAGAAASTQLDIALATVRDLAARLEAREAALDRQLEDLDRQRQRLEAAEAVARKRAAETAVSSQGPTRRRSKPKAARRSARPAAKRRPQKARGARRRKS